MGQDEGFYLPAFHKLNVSGKPPYSEKELISKANVTSIRTPSHRLKFYYLDGVLCKADLRVGA
ncbi:MAG: hypothetical protein KA713_09220 [Chryseotalea sp. WA131a]|nr:MAG: hypothetical protein KA713_09220 [Chryseotalea sp. WA131a]